MPQNLSENSQNAMKMVEELIEKNQVLEESWAEASAAILSLAQDDAGWLPINKVQGENGFSLATLKEVALYADVQSAINPLLKQGLNLRTNRVFGRGVSFETEGSGTGIPPRFQKIVDRPINQNTLFTEEAYERNERELYNKGTFIMAYRRSTNTFFAIPFYEITSSASNPDLVDDVWYYQRTYLPFDYEIGTVATENVVEWYPVLEHYEDGVNKLAKKLGSDKSPVDPDVVIVDLKVNRSIGQVWGIPDVLPAMPYAWAHAEYIRDAQKLLKALSTIAWKVVARTKGNSSTAAVQMNGSKKTASTATMTNGTDLVSMPRAGQVDMSDGQAIAAYVASALGVSLIALLSDPGSASGSYGAAASLDGPSADSARARQKLWAAFYKRIYRLIGIKDIEVVFPNINEDPVFRKSQTLALGFASGAIWQDEFRDAFLETNDIEPQHTDVPGANIFTNAAKFSLEAITAEAKAEQHQITGTPDYEDNGVQNGTGQGQSTGVGALANDDNSLRDNAAKPGTSGKA